MNKISRREFLYMGAMTAAGVALAACQPKTAVVQKTPEVKEATKEPTKEVKTEKLVTPTALPSKFKESPATAAQVSEGKLPAVDERLPSEPLVITPYEKIGQYGGQIRTGGLGTSLYDGDCDLVTGRVQNLLRITPNLREAVPNLLKDWSMSSDFKVLTCYMRKGMKWSDGQPLTADDWMFLWEDVFLNTDITPVIGQWFRVGGTPAICEKLDDYSFRLTFAGPNPSFVMVNMAHEYGMWSDNVIPAHYLKQFHIKYNPKAEDLAKAAGRDFWYQHFGDMRNVGQNIEVPKDRAFVPVDRKPERALHKRNPYFWMTDSDGNQLPYIDEATLAYPADLALHNAKIVGGEYDFSGFDTNIQNYKTYTDAADKGGYKVILWRSGKGSDVVYQVNCNWGLPASPDEKELEGSQVWRDIFFDDRFRKALSLAINRDEVNEVLYFGRGEPRQMTVIPDSRHFKPEYATAWAQYDPDQANKLLDELGLKWDAEKKHRLWPDGQPMVITWDLYESETPKGPTTELIKEYWMKIGIEIVYKSITRTLLTQKILANQEPMSLWHGDETTDVLFCRRPKFFVPLDGDESCWGVLWGRWYNTKDSPNRQGVEPPQVIKDLYTWLDEYIQTDANEPAAKILQSQAEHIWVIGVVGNAPHPLVVNKKLTNVSPDGYWVWDSLWTWPVYPEQWFFAS